MKNLFRAVLLCLNLAFAVSIQAKISAMDPAGSPNYDYVDWLEAYDCALPTLRSLRPVGHFEISQALKLRRGHSPCKAPDWLLTERNLIQRPALQNDIYASVFFTHNDLLPLQGLESFVNGLYPQREGRPTFNGPNLLFEFNANEELGTDLGVALSATPGWVAGWDNYQNFNGRFYLQEGYLKLGYQQLEVTWGRTALRFGNAKHGSLLLGGATKPIDLWKLGVRPFALFDVLPITIDTWIAAQGDSRFLSNARLWGLELGMRPADWLEFAFLELYEYGGNGAPMLQNSDYLDMLYYSSDPALDSKRFPSLAMNLSGWFPDHTAQLYTQALFSKLGSVANWLSDDLNVMAGVWFPTLWEGGARLEYVHTVPKAYRSSYWQQGLSYQGTPLGHPIGPDGEAAYLDVGLPAFEQWRPEINLFYEGRYLHPQTGFSTEWRYGFGAGLKTRWGNAALELTARYAYAVNYFYLPKNNQNIAAGFALFRYSFF